LLALLIGVPMGVYTALRRNSVLSNVLHDAVADRHFVAHLPDRYPADLGVSVSCNWLPSFGRGDVSNWAGGLPGC
jgi:peptide/nickel transport system permease protein